MDKARETITSSGFAKRIGVEAFMVLVMGFVLGLIGPFGTFEMPIGLRLVYWMIFGLLGFAIFRPMIITGEWLSEALGLSAMIGIGLTLAVAAVPMTLLVAVMFSGFDLAAAFHRDDFGRLYFQVWLIGFLINGVFQLTFRKAAHTAPEAGSVAETAPLEPAPPAFHDRLPAGFGPLLALKGEDHYVRAIGDTREELVLIRLRDAVAELGDAAGTQVHRSWWVAKDAVTRINREGRSATLILTNGSEVPVSRENMARLKTLFGK